MPASTLPTTMKRSLILLLSTVLILSACAGKPAPAGPPAATATSTAFPSPPTVTSELASVMPTVTPAEGSSEALARQFQLPAGYLAEKIFIPPMSGALYIARSQGGVIYVSHFIHNAGLSILDPVEKKATRILDLPSEAGNSLVVGGPGDSALIGVNDEIWQVHPDGSHSVWGKRGGRPQTFTSDGRLLGSSHDGKSVAELLPDGSAREIAAGFSDIFNLVASADGKIYVSDWDTGDITRLDPDGSRHVVVKHLVVNDPIDLGLDEGGNLYFNSSSTGPMGGFVKMEAVTGAFTRYNLVSQTCTEHLSDFVFTAPGKLVFVDPTISQVAWEDLNTHTGGLLVGSQGANTHAAAIGPDDALYLGTRGCGTDLPAQVVRLGDDGSRRVYVDGLQGDIRDLTFDADGGLYVAASIPGKGGALHYVPLSGGNPILIPGGTPYNVSSIVVDPHSGHLLITQYGSDTISEFSLEGLAAEHPIRLPKKAANFVLAASWKGQIYAFVSEWERRNTGPVVERWLLAIDLQKGTSEKIYPYDHQGCCVMGNLDVDGEGNIWWMVNPEFEIYRVEPGGEAVLFARNLPIDPASISVNRQGEIYFTSSGGIYRIYKRQ